MQQQQHQHKKINFTHYAGAEFENSPQASELPLPPIDWILHKKVSKKTLIVAQQSPQSSYPAKTYKIKKKIFQTSVK